MADQVGGHSLFYSCAVWVRHHLYIVTVPIIVALLLLSAYSYIRESLQQRVTLLTGPEGSFNSDIGELLHEKFGQEPAWRFWGRSFELTPHETDGSQQNRWRVDEDRQGRLLGVSIDGFSSTPHVRTMLHLTDVPLLILARPEFLTRVPNFTTSNASLSEATQHFITRLLLVDPFETIVEAAVRVKVGHVDDNSFFSIAEYVKYNPGHFYLGDIGSGTRALAKRVLESYDVSVEDVDRHRQMSFTQAVDALEEKQLDVAFFLLPVDTDFVVDALRRKAAQIVGLDQTAGFLKRFRFLRPETLETGTFGMNIPPRKLATVKARMVLVCSDSMPANDAYWLTKSIAEFLRGDNGLSLADDLTPDSDGVSYKLHDGARMFHDQIEPWYVIGSRNSIQWLLSVLVLTPLAVYAPGFLGQLLKRLSTSLETSKNEPADGTAPEPLSSAKTGSRAPGELLQQTKRLCADLDTLPAKGSSPQLAEIFNRFKDLDLAIQTATPSTQLEHKSLDEARHGLKEAEETMLQFEVVKRTPLLPPASKGSGAKAKKPSP